MNICNNDDDDDNDNNDNNVVKEDIKVKPPTYNNNIQPTRGTKEQCLKRTYFIFCHFKINIYI